MTEQVREQLSAATNQQAGATVNVQPNPIVAALLAAFPSGVTDMATPYEIPQVSVLPQELPAVAAWLKEHGFNMLQDVGGVDYLPRIPRFEVVYHLLSISTMTRIRLRIPVAAENPQVPTLSHLWVSANPAEREVYDLFGIEFTGHPNMSRILLPTEWEGHPLRKDYPLQGPRAAENRFAANAGRFHAPKQSN